MPLNIFSSRQLSWLQEIDMFDFLGPIITAQQRLIKIDDAKIFIFLRKHDLTYADDFMLMLGADDQLHFCQTEQKFASHGLLLMINQPNRQNLQNNKTVKQPIMKRQLRGLRDLSQDKQTNLNLELNGIYYQLLHLQDLLFDQNTTTPDLLFNYRVYPVVFQYVLNEYHLPQNVSASEITTQVTQAVNDILSAYLWIKVNGLVTNVSQAAQVVTIGQVISCQAIKEPLEKLDYLKLTSNFYGQLH